MSSTGRYSSPLCRCWAEPLLCGLTACLPCVTHGQLVERTLQAPGSCATYCIVYCILYVVALLLGLYTAAITCSRILFFVQNPEHWRLFTYRYPDEDIYALSAAVLLALLLFVLSTIVLCRVRQAQRRRDGIKGHSCFVRTPFGRSAHVHTDAHASSPPFFFRMLAPDERCSPSPHSPCAQDCCIAVWPCLAPCAVCQMLRHDGLGKHSYEFLSSDGGEGGDPSTKLMAVVPV